VESSQTDVHHRTRKNAVVGYGAPNQRQRLVHQICPCGSRQVGVLVLESTGVQCNCSPFVIHRGIPVNVTPNACGYHHNWVSLRSPVQQRSGAQQQVMSPSGNTVVINRRSVPSITNGITANGWGSTSNSQFGSLGSGHNRRRSGR